MSSRDRYRKPPQQAYYESCESDSQSDTSDARKSANVAAKRSKPDLAITKSHEGRRKEGIDSGYSSRAPTVSGEDLRRRGYKPEHLTLDTTSPILPDRERRPYHSNEAWPESARTSSSRPSAPRSDSKVAKGEALYQHRPEDGCWICDKYGQHIDPPPNELPPTRPIPLSPQSALYQPAPNPYVTEHPPTVRPATRERTASHRSERPSTYYAGMTLDSFYQPGPLPHPYENGASPPMSAGWTTPLSPSYPTFIRTPVIAVTPYSYQDEMQQASYPSLQSAPRPRPVELHRHPSTPSKFVPPVVQYPSTHDPRRAVDRPTLHHERSHDHTRDQRSEPPHQRATRDENHDRNAMPPPPRPNESRHQDSRSQEPQVILAHRPSIKKSANSSNATRTSYQRYDDDYGDDRVLQIAPPHQHREQRNSDPPPPPTAFRQRSKTSAFPERDRDRERPSAKKAYSHDNGKYSTEVARSRAESQPHPLTRRATVQSTENVERHEKEAEAYQHCHGSSDSHPMLTADALRRLPPRLSARSDTGSSQKSRNSSSKGSSNAKTGRSDGITMTINGVTLGFSGDTAENANIQIQSQQDGGVNISVGGGDIAVGRKESDFMLARLEKAPSVTSKASRSSRGVGGRESEREKRHGRGEDLYDRRSVKDDTASDRASRRSSRSGYSSMIASRGGDSRDDPYPPGTLVYGA